MMVTTISRFHTSFYIPEIQKLVFHISQVQILGINHCGDSLQNAFKRCKYFQDVPCCRDYDDGVVASLPHKIKSELYGENKYVSIDAIVFEHFTVLPEIEINSSTKSCPHHETFSLFFS